MDVCPGSTGGRLRHEGGEVSSLGPDPDPARLRRALDYWGVKPKGVWRER